MSRHFWRACNRRAGFSFVELLVTIIIAGIAFAALVPVFVGASQASSAEKMRNVALNVAQGRLEKIRDLDYEQVTDLNLNSPSAYFGPNAEPELGPTAGTRYSVSTVVTAAPNTTDSYKLVVVRVSWTNLGGRQGSTVLKTYVYSQWVGPHILDVAFNPAPIKPDPALYRLFEKDVWLTSTSEDIEVSLELTDVASMAPTSDNPQGGRVEVRVTSQSSGDIYPVGTLYGRDNPDNSLYSIPWTGESASDGMYSVSATAYSAAGFQGNVYETSIRIETGEPEPPGEIVPVVGPTAVILTWTPSASRDVVRYVLTRTYVDPDTSLATTDTVSGPEDASTPFAASAYNDQNLTTDMLYTYRLWAVDAVGNPSIVREKQVTPQVVSDPFPLPPTSLAASIGGNTVRLSWTASTSTYIAGYNVYVQGVSPSPYTTVGPGTTVANLTLEFDTPYTFEVAAWSPGGESSKAVVTARTEPQTFYTLNIRNNSSSPAKTALYIALDLLNSSTGAWITDVQTEQADIAPTQSAGFANLAAGKYRYRWKLDQHNATEETRIVTLSGATPIVSVTLY